MNGHTIPCAFAGKVSLLEEVVLHWRLIDGSRSCKEAKTQDTDKAELCASAELQFPYQRNRKNREQQVCSDVDGCAGQQLKQHCEDVVVSYSY